MKGTILDSEIAYIDMLLKKSAIKAGERKLLIFVISMIPEKFLDLIESNFFSYAPVYQNIFIVVVSQVQTSKSYLFLMELFCKNNIHSVETVLLKVLSETKFPIEFLILDMMDDICANHHDDINLRHKIKMLIRARGSESFKYIFERSPVILHKAWFQEIFGEDVFKGITYV